MTINLKGKDLVVTFKFNREIVAAIKSVTGRQFDLNKKHWLVPVESTVECVDKLKPFGLIPTLQVKREYDKQKGQELLAKEIKITPAEYAGTLPLFDFQKIGVRFLKTMPHALLADAPGLGKTIQTIAATEEDCNRLVFCPASLKYSWADEIKKWRPNDVVVVIDGNKKERAELWIKKADWIIANYELLLHDFDWIKIHEKSFGPWGVVVSDEATRISNPLAKTSKLIKQLSSKKRIALTGTPISNTPLDIFSIIDWIVPRYLGTYWNFLERYAIREPRFHRVVGFKNLEELSDKVARFTLRRTKEEVLKDLPPKTVEDVPFELTQVERKLYDGVRMLILSELQNLEVNKSTLAIIPVKMLRLKQAVDHPALLTSKKEHSSKLEVLKELIKPIIGSGDRVIVFTQFAEMAKLLQDNLDVDGTMFKPFLIHGEVEVKERQNIVDHFNSPDSKMPILIMTEAGAYGLNLQSASYVVHYDAPWSIAKLMQREDRAHRIGQLKPVTVYNLIAKNTIDEYVAKTLHRKQKISVDIMKDEERLEDLGMTEEDINAILRI